MRILNRHKQIISLMALCCAFGVHAGDVVIEQKDIQFWVGGKALKPGDEVHAKVGDTLRIVNLDKATHNAFSLSEKFFFDGGAQKPKSEGGQDITAKIESAGMFDVACAIHPNMTLKLKVD